MASTDNQIGVIKSFSIRNGYGFISSIEGISEDVFFGKEQIPVEWQALGPKLEGTEVTFDIVTGPEGKMQGRNLTPVNAPQIGQQTSGIVKSWNAQKGFGFLSCPGIDVDIFFARDRLPVEFQQLSHMDGMTMLFNLMQCADGKMQAQNMQAPGSEAIANQMGGQRKRPAPVESLPTKRMNLALENGRQVGTVKSFSNKNGFGFIVCSKSVEDIIFYNKDVQHEPQQGDSVEFTVRSNKNGRPQAYEVKPSSGKPVPKMLTQSSTAREGYPPLTIDDIKLYTEQLSPEDLSELAIFTTKVLQRKLSMAS